MKFKYTENVKLFKAITEGLRKSKVELGEYYCPCKLEKTTENICPCVELKEDDVCHCGLYEKVGE